MTGVNRRVRAVGVGAVVLIVTLFAMLNYLQIFHANALDDNPHNTSGVIPNIRNRGAPSFRRTVSHWPNPCRARTSTSTSGSTQTGSLSAR